MKLSEYAQRERVIMLALRGFGKSAMALQGAIRFGNIKLKLTNGKRVRLLKKQQHKLLKHGCT